MFRICILIISHSVTLPVKIEAGHFVRDVASFSSKVQQNILPFHNFYYQSYDKFHFLCWRDADIEY